jgi:putative tryptophan/tyrosine transport system substrate-binding protein
MRRREFIAAFGSAAAWPLVARAQQPKAMRRIGVLTGGFGPDSQARLEAFLRALAQLGWTEGQNMRLEIRRGGGDSDTIRKHAAELAALAPDVIMAIGGTATGHLLQATRTVPIRVCNRARSSRLRFRRKPVAAGRQCYRVHAV